MNDLLTNHHHQPLTLRQRLLLRLNIWLNIRRHGNADRYAWFRQNVDTIARDCKLLRDDAAPVVNVRPVVIYHDEAARNVYFCRPLHKPNPGATKPYGTVIPFKSPVPSEFNGVYSYEIFLNPRAEEENGVWRYQADNNLPWLVYHDYYRAEIAFYPGYRVPFNEVAALTNDERLYHSRLNKLTLLISE